MTPTLRFRDAYRKQGQLKLCYLGANLPPYILFLLAMQFLYPAFLWALLALIIPIIVHLFSFRRFKKVRFTNVRFLQEIKEETSNKSKLKNLLTLLMRLLALAALIFAFAQPYLAKKDSIKEGNNAVSVFIDNSFSMNARQDETPLVEMAKAKAREIFKAYGEEDKFQILTHDFEGKHQRLLTKEDAINSIDEIQLTPEVKTLRQIYNRQIQSTSQGAENQILYIISDFQESILPSSTGEAFEMLSDSIAEVNFIPIQSVIEQNVSIDTAWFEAPVPLLNQNNRLLVKISNHSDKEIEDVRLSYVKDGQNKPEGTFTIQANDYIIDTINLSIIQPGSQNVELKISDYPVQFDDSYLIAFDVPDKVRVLSIHERSENKYLSAVFKGLNYYELTNQNVSQLQYSDFASFSLIIINDLNNISSGLSAELNQYIVNGGNVLLFPGDKALEGNINNFLNGLGTNTLLSWSVDKKESTSLNTNEFVFNNVFDNSNQNLKLPITNGNYAISNYQSRGEKDLIRYRDGSPYMASYDKGAGQFFICTSPLASAYNDLVLNAEIFVPLVYKSALSKKDGSLLSYIIGDKTAIEVNNTSITGDILYHIKGQESFIPGQSKIGNKVLLDVNDQVEKAGFYQLTLSDQVIKNLAFNYDRKESNLNVATSEKLSELFSNKVNIFENALSQDFTQLVGEKDRGIQLWKWFLIATLVFLALESLLLRFMKG